ncbi:MAG: hypothetical protein KKE42_09580 [Alphaproteobacteria bacterium]|uniref:hypothetical protein n=1 Tax=Brevundimonas sp. TaxID=1871086 RepID=UPI001EBB016F|nr:hypothetical protein [Brevundimonas sp.]MBU3974034.1 hypothetical protein [Alphaproteobacteria bacterium]
MSEFLVLAFAGLLLQQAAPHPSTQAAYQAPAVRPFEPGPGFGRERAQGDADADLYRRPLEAPVTVEAYVRSYEYTPSDVEAAYEQGVASAEIRADQAAGPLDGAWRIVDAAGRALYDLVLADPGVGPVEGGWSSESGAGAATSDGTTLTLEGAGALTLERSGSRWRGMLTAGGGARSVSLIRPD